MKRSTVLIAATVLTILCGCSLTPQVVNMVPLASSYSPARTERPISVGAVDGGEESDPMWKGSRISDMDLRAALARALQDARYNLISSGTGVDYVLTARILFQEQPGAGFDMTATLKVRYSLSRSGTTEPFWFREIRSSYKATMGQAFSGAERLNKANEGAVRENLKELLNELAKLDL